MTIPRPSLDRAAELREEPDVLDRLRNDPATRVIVVREAGSGSWIPRCCA